MNLTCPTCHQPIPQASGVTVDAPRGIVTRNGVTARLALLETRIFLLLLRHLGNVVAHESIYDDLYSGTANGGPDGMNNSIRVRIVSLRRKLAPLGFRIELAWGMGYALHASRLDAAISKESPADASIHP